MKQKIYALLALVLFALPLTGCGGQPEKDGISVVAAIFPEYDWARQIIGDCAGVQLHFLVDDGVDPHSFQPAVKSRTRTSRLQRNHLFLRINRYLRLSYGDSIPRRL